MDSSLVSRKVRRADVNAYYIPATQMSNDQGYQTLANMILMGYVIAKTGMIPQDMIASAMKKVVSCCVMSKKTLQSYDIQKTKVE